MVPKATPRPGVMRGSRGARFYMTGVAAPAAPVI